MLMSNFAEDGTPVTQLTRGSERIVRVCCDDCGKISTTTWSNYRQGQRTRHETNGKTYCQPCIARRTGIASRGRKILVTRKYARREDHTSWRGGRYIDQSGYVMVWVGTRSETSGWSSYRREHVVVMEKFLGRPLNAGEKVHHINNDKQHNACSNLYLTTSVGHRLAHVSLTLAFMLLRAAGLVPNRARPTTANVWQAYADGKVYFDASQGIYVADLKLRELLEHPIDAGRGQSAAKPTRNGRKVQRLGHGDQTGR